MTRDDGEMAIYTTVTSKLTWRGAETVVFTAAWGVLGPSLTTSRFDPGKQMACGVPEETRTGKGGQSC